MLKTGQDQKLTTNKKSPIFELSSWNINLSGAPLKVYNKFSWKHFCYFDHLPNRVQIQMILHSKALTKCPKAAFYYINHHNSGNSFVLWSFKKMIKITKMFSRKLAVNFQSSTTVKLEIWAQSDKKWENVKILLTYHLDPLKLPPRGPLLFENLIYPLLTPWKKISTV